MDVPAALRALREVDYGGLVAVELSRHAHAAHETVPRAIEVLRGADREEVQAT
jgi:sugar phosphate isomerase/epimerase